MSVRKYLRGATEIRNKHSSQSYADSSKLIESLSIPLFLPLYLSFSHPLYLSLSLFLSTPSSSLSPPLFPSPSPSLSLSPRDNIHRESKQTVTRT